MDKKQETEKETVREELLHLVENLSGAERSPHAIKSAEEFRRKIGAFSSEELLKPFTI